MNFTHYVKSGAHDYKQFLLNDLKANVELTNLINLIFFPESLDIEVWLESTEVTSFYEYRYKGDSFVNRFCTREEIDSIPPVNIISGDFYRYTFLSYLKCNTYEEAIEKASAYYLIQKDFYKEIDRIFFDKLKENKWNTDENDFFEKKISECITLTLSVEREYMEVKGLIGYAFPTLSIKVKNEGSIEVGTIDVRSLLFMPGSSFLFFYLDSHNVTIDKKLGVIRDVQRKHDEPIIYLGQDNKYVITNSLVNIDRYNKYIRIILELSSHFLTVFEKWLTHLPVTNRI